MSLQISPIGIVIALIIYAITFLALRPVFRALGRKKVLRNLRWPLGALLLILPWTDEFWISWHFSRLCENSGVHISRSVRADGFYDETMPSGYEYIERLGFRYMEHPSRNSSDLIDHIEKAGDQWVVTPLSQPRARYRYRKSSDNEVVGYRIYKLEYVLLDDQTSTIVARNTIYKRYRGWIEGLWVRHLGSGLTICPDPELNSRQPPFPASAILPNSNRR